VTLLEQVMNEQAALIGADQMNASASKKRILILGGGFGGVYTARRHQHLWPERRARGRRRFAAAALQT
jgi:hypothetical protein